MQEKNMRYGKFLRSKRISDSRELTIKDIAVELGISASLVCDVEQGRRKPFDEAKTQKLIKFLHLSEEDTALLYDLAAKECDYIPRDLDDIMMYIVKDDGSWITDASYTASPGYWMDVKNVITNWSADGYKAGNFLVSSVLGVLGINLFDC